MPADEGCYRFAMQYLASHLPRPSLLLAAIVLAACGGTAPKVSTSDSSHSGPAIYAKKVSLTWAFQRAATTEVFLETTDETGRKISHSLGSYQGDCAVRMPGADMKAVTGVVCGAPGGGVELHAAVQNGDIIVLKLPTEPGRQPDPMSRQQVARIPVPPGAAVEVGAQ